VVMEGRSCHRSYAAQGLPACILLHTCLLSGDVIEACVNYHSKDNDEQKTKDCEEVRKGKEARRKASINTSQKRASQRLCHRWCMSAPSCTTIGLPGYIDSFPNWMKYARRCIINSPLRPADGKLYSTTYLVPRNNRPMFAGN
jgi:hypothetical protein